MTTSIRTGDVARDLAWIVATTIGLIVGGFVLHFPGSFGEAAWQPVAMLFGAILGFMTGVAVGLVQWAGLRLRRRSGLRLLCWMGVGIAITHGLEDGAAWSLGIVALSLLCGFGMAAAYAACLEDRRPVPLLLVGLGWTGSILLASAIVDIMGLPWEETPVGWSTEHAVDGIVVGLVWGAMTVIAGVPARLRAGLPVNADVAAPEGAA